MCYQLLVCTRSRGPYPTGNVVVSDPQVGVEVRMKENEIFSLPGDSL